jgi:hypothetical protein
LPKRCNKDTGDVMMAIRVIEQSTSERKQATIDLFQQCKPYLEDGMGLVQAVKIVRNINYNSFQNLSWYKELRAYATEQGYIPQR